MFLGMQIRVDYVLLRFALPVRNGVETTSPGIVVRSWKRTAGRIKTLSKNPVENGPPVFWLFFTQPERLGRLKPFTLPAPINVGYATLMLIFLPVCSPLLMANARLMIVFLRGYCQLLAANARLMLR